MLISIYLIYSGSEVLFNKVGRQNLFDMLLDRLVNEPMQVRTVCRANEALIQ